MDDNTMQYVGTRNFSLTKKFGGSVQRNVINNSNGPSKKLGLLNVFIFCPQLRKKYPVKEQK